MPYTISQIAKVLHGTVEGDDSLVIQGFSQIDQAGKGDLVFAESEAFFHKAAKSGASAILVAGDFESFGKTLIRVANARVAFAKALAMFFPPPPVIGGIHPSAVVATSAQVDPSACVGPLCVIGENTRVGARAHLQGSCHVGRDCNLEDDVHLLPNVTIYDGTILGARVRIHAGTVIGSDGFGYVFDQGTHLKVPQIGKVIVEEDVEIGANVTVDRGALGATVIGRGTKIDNLVQIAHNVVVGEGSILVAQVGIAGSTHLGNFVTLAGQVGVAGHLKLGNRVTVGAQSGVMSDIPDGEQWLGSPAIRDKEAKRQYVAIRRLPDLMRKWLQFEKTLSTDRE